MKIGILTFQKTTNYGAQLQCYALQKYLNNTFGQQRVSCEVIQYQCEAILQAELPMQLRGQRSPKDIVKYFLFHKIQQERLDRFEAFEKKYMPMSRALYTRENISKSAELYDLFIVGSDQVWNVNLTDRDFAFFLDFLSDRQKKYSYAASFGYGALPPDIKDKAIDLLAQFSFLTVREEQARQILRQNLNRDVPLVCDPTLLLPAKEWEQLAELPPDSPKKFIFAYYIDWDDHLTWSVIRQLAAKHDCEIVFCYHGAKKKRGVHNIKNASPQHFLAYIQHAAYVVAGSFHSLCFSLIFQKNFYYTLTLTKESGNPSRIVNMMEQYGLSSREIKEGRQLSEQPIDHATVQQMMAHNVQQSQLILKEMIYKRKAEM